MKKNFFISITLIIIGFATFVFDVDMSTEVWSDYRRFGDIEPPSPIFDILPALGFIIIVLGVISLIVSAVNACRPTVEKECKIINISKNSRSHDLVLVEYSDENRDKVYASKKLCIAIGDYGKIQIKAKVIQKFDHM